MGHKYRYNRLIGTMNLQDEGVGSRLAAQDARLISHRRGRGSALKNFDAQEQPDKGGLFFGLKELASEPKPQKEGN